MDARKTLLDWSNSNSLSDAKLSDDGQSLTKGDVTLPNQKITVEHDGKSCEYTLASIYLLIVNPDQGTLPYRNACKQYNVDDAVKTLDKATVVGYFVGATAPKEPPVQAEAKPKSDKREKDKDRKRKAEHKSKDKRRSSSDKSREKKVAATVTTDELLSNLDTVAGKRNEENAVTNEDITKALSAEGFEVTPELLEEHRDLAQTIMAHEIPVGDSSSILLAENPHKDLSKVLQTFDEFFKPQADGKVPHRKPQISKPHLIGKKPIIVVPKSQTAPLTIVNAHDFFANSRFMPRDVLVKQGKHRNPATTFTRSFRGGRLIEYEIIDNPRKLGEDRAEWERIVAVVVLGQSWQFKGWKRGYEKPVDLFANAYGFFVSMEGDKIPGEVSGWSVEQSRLNRDKRGLDSVTYASFWNGLDEWMTIHRPQLLQIPGDVSK